MAWSYAARLATPCFAVSSSVEIPDKKAGWLQRKPLPENQKMIWYEMACLRRSQTGMGLHKSLSTLERVYKTWSIFFSQRACLDGRVINICPMNSGATIAHRSYLVYA